jgi:hypothetical protein
MLSRLSKEPLNVLGVDLVERESSPGQAEVLDSPVLE